VSHLEANAGVEIEAPPARVAAVLADPDAPRRLFGLDVRRGGPVPVRWRGGSRFSVAMSVHGEEAVFDVRVGRLTRQRLDFVASGPIVIDATGDLRTAGMGRTWMELSAAVSGRGFAGELAAAVAAGVLRGGTLGRILAAVKRHAERVP